MILILYLSLMYKTMGGATWTGILETGETKCPVAESDPAAGSTPVTPSFAEATGIEDENVEAVVIKFSLAWHSLKQVFTATVLRGLLGFSAWWCCLAWFASSAIGMGYLSYFAKV